VKKTFFSLIEGGKVRIAPDTKVVRADDIATLLDAQQIVDKVQDEADAVRAQAQKEGEALKQQVAAEAERIKKQAYAEGFEQGQKVWVEHVERLDRETKQVHKELREMVVPVALQAAKKIVGREMQMHPETIVDIVANNLRAVASHRNIVIYVNKADYATFDANKPRLKQVFEHLESLVLQESKDVQPDGCIIETEGGIINAQLDNQWALLEKAFESVMKDKLPPLEGDTASAPTPTHSPDKAPAPQPAAEAPVEKTSPEQPIAEEPALEQTEEESDWDDTESDWDDSDDWDSED
jgi:type III secretion protein L